MTDTFTKNYRFTKPDFNSAPWHGKLSHNFDQIDAVLFRSLVADGITVWTNDHGYVFGDITVDPADGTFWMCVVPHTSAAVGTMKMDRAANPGYWNGIALSVTAKGAWLNNTQYILGDIVFDNAKGITAICVESHISSGAPNTITDDAVYWSFIVQINAANTPFTASGTITATNVQAAIQELDSENQAAHTGFSGLLTAHGSAITDLQNSRVRYDVAQTLNADQRSHVHASIGPRPYSAFLNGSLHISQETGMVLQTAGDKYPADLWYCGMATSGSFSYGLVASRTPAGNPNRMRFTCVTADASVASTDFVGLYYAVEGWRTLPFKSGTLAAKRGLLTFGYNGAPGTWAVAFRNGALNRARAETFTITAPQANQDVRVVIPVQMDTTGVWPIDNTLGMVINFTFMAGSTYSDIAGVWQSTSRVGVNGQSNIMATAGNKAEIFDLDFWCDVVDDPGHVPEDYPTVLRACQRYVATTYLPGTPIGTATNAGCLFHYPDATTNYANFGPWSYPGGRMRTTPSIVIYNPVTGTTGTFRNTDLSTNITAAAQGFDTQCVIYAGGVSVGTSQGMNAHAAAYARLY